MQLVERRSSNSVSVVGCEWCLDLPSSQASNVPLHILDRGRQSWFPCQALLLIASALITSAHFWKPTDDARTCLFHTSIE